MASGTQGENYVEDVERLDRSNFTLFRQWERAAPAKTLLSAALAAFSRRALRFNSLIVAREFVVWEMHCSQPWNHLRRSFQFRQLDLPFKLKESPLVIPVDEITDWTIQEDAPALRTVLWRGGVALPTFVVPSRDRAVTLEKTIRAAIARLNPAAASR